MGSFRRLRRVAFTGYPNIRLLLQRPVGNQWQLLALRAFKVTSRLLVTPWKLIKHLTQSLMWICLQCLHIRSRIALTILLDTAGSSSPYHVPSSSEYTTNVTTSPHSPQELIIESDSLEQEVSYSPAVDNNQSAGGGKAPRRRRDPKPKLYQREEPLSNPEEEKKRQNAINAKKNRDKQKNRLQELDALVKSLTLERDELLASNNKLLKKSNAFERQLRTICQQFNVPVIILPQD